MFHRLPIYIGRSRLKEIIRKQAAQVERQNICRAIYIRAGGGLGKSRLIDLLPQILHEDSSPSTDLVERILIPQTIDLYSYESRSPTVAEKHLIDGLCQSTPGTPFRLPPAEVNALFASYYEALTAYRQARDFGAITEREQRLVALDDAFVDCWNKMTASHPAIICFDTFETLFNPKMPDEALANTPHVPSRAGKMRQWLEATLPRLQHTLVLICGRPLDNDTDQSFINALQRSKVMIEPVQELDAFDDLEGIRNYLQAYQVRVEEMKDDDLRHILIMTEGTPLLLTCFAETRRPDGVIPPNLPLPHEIGSRSHFQTWLVETLLNPMEPITPYPLSPAQQTMIYSLYFLVYGRRGLQPAQLHDLFSLLGKEYVLEVVDELHNLALVKYTNGLLFLHDEIYEMIDVSKQADYCGLKNPTLDYLCTSSAERVEALFDVESLEIIGAMADHVYYELRRDFTKGYRTYIIYIERLLKQRNTGSALVLSSAFWSVLARLPELILDSEPRYQEVLRDELVRRVKLLRALDQNQAAIELGDKLYERFVAEGFLPPDDVEPLGDYVPRDCYLYVDLKLIRALVTGQVSGPAAGPREEMLFGHAITLLESPVIEDLSEDLLFFRRPLFKGTAHMLRGFLRRGRQQFTDAIADGEQARKAFREYHKDQLPGKGISAEMLLHDRVIPELAQVTNNLAYLKALTGDFRRANHYADEVLKLYIPQVLPYQRALFYNTKALILLREGKYREAQPYIEDAEKAAHQSRSRRAEGLVHQARAQIQRALMVEDETPLPEITQRYEQAEDLLSGDNNALYDLYYDWGGYARDLGVLYMKRKEHKSAQTFLEQALDLLDKARQRAGSPIQAADLLDRKLTVLNLMGHFEKASDLLTQAEELMTQPMPEYGQMVSGKLALQKGYITMYRDHDYATALRQWSIALARAYVFGQKHRDQATFERLIEEWIRSIPPEALSAFFEATNSKQLAITADDLGYQRPDPSQWAAAWRASINYINESITIHLED